jgi:hypothetical protein
VIVMSTDRPTYEGAAFAVDSARDHAAAGDWAATGDRAHEALERVSDAPYPHLVDRLHRQATDVVLSCKREEVDGEHVRATLDGMQTTVDELQALALSGTTMFPDELRD